MAEKEDDIKQMEHRTKTMRSIYPFITQQQAVKIDKLMVDGMDQLMTSIHEAGVKNAGTLGISEDVTTALLLMYLKSNVDDLFKRAFG